MSPIYKRDRVQLESDRPRASHAHAAPAAPAKAARLIAIEGVVRAIEVTCACGERTVIELELADAPRTSSDRHA